MVLVGMHFLNDIVTWLCRAAVTVHIRSVQTTYAGDEPCAQRENVWVNEHSEEGGASESA